MKYFILALILSNTIWSQNLDTHLWENRVIVISSDKDNEAFAEKQFTLLKLKRQELIDRKLVVYKCVENSCVLDDFKNSEKLVRINKKAKGFSVKLIGLDGGEKYKSKQVEDAKVFFNLIDKMPMRRQELNNRR